MAEDKGKGGNGASESEIAERIITFLRSGNYDVAKQAIIYLETRSGQLQTDAFANMRDVLDHLVAAAKPGILEEDLDQQMAETDEHLRRAVMHPFQDVIEDRLARLARKKTFYIVRQEVFKDVLPEREFLRRLTEAENLLAEVRLRKGDGRGENLAGTIEILQRCFDELEELGQQIRPNSRAVAVRWTIFVLLTIFSALVGAAIALAIAH